ncbi:MAG: TonB-dependent receptor [Algibacter sp.]
MKKLKTILNIESNGFKFDLKKTLTVLVLLVSLMQINAKTYSLNSNNSLELKNGEIQQVTVTGIITDDSGIPLPGASVLLKGTTNGVSTDFDGHYTINVSNGDTTLVVSYIGFVTQEIAIGGKSTINVVLATDNTDLDEVVVVGYGVQRKRDITGAISQVKGDDLVLSSSPSVLDVLRGKASGLQITQNSAQPGGGLDLQIRGAGSINASNDPLIVVDGFPLSPPSSPVDGNRYSGGTQGILNSFNPNDIESIEVLKDASSSAIYGARAANGVILITTKKGKTGKVSVAYSTSVSYQQFDKDDYDVLSLPEWMQLRNDAAFENWSFLNRVAPYSDRTLEEANADPVLGVAFSRFYSDEEINNAGQGTDWLDLISRDGIIQQHNISLNGGTESTRYYMSANLYEHKGVIENSNFDRSSFRINLDQKVNDYINVGMSLTMSRINNDFVPLGGQAFENSGLIRSAIQYSPLVEAIDENGNYPINSDNALTPNPFSLLTITDEGETDKLLANFYLEVKPFKGFVARVQGGIDQGINTRRTYLPKTTLWGERENGRASIANVQNNDKLLDVTLTYNTTISEDHKFTALLGYSNQQFKETSYNAGNSNFITDAFLWNNLNAGGGTKVTASAEGTDELVSFFGRLNYIYKDRYILSSTIRRDGSGKFSENNQFATFPSVSFGWNVAEEPFMKNIKDKVSQFKFRLGYGQLGNQDIGDNAFDALVALPSYLGPDESILVGVLPSRLGNAFLKWETTKEANFGLDFGFFRNRISGSIDVFDKEVSGLLADRNLNSFNPVSVLTANVGTSASKGVELTLNTVNIRTKDFSWKSTLTYSKYEDVWKERHPDFRPSIFESDNDPLRAQFSYLSDGIMQVGDDVPAQPGLFPGQIKLKDVNGFLRDASGNPQVDEDGRFIATGEADGIIDEADIVLLGSSDPDYIAGFSNTIQYKNFQLNFHFNGVFGRQIIDATDFAYGVSAVGVATNGNNATTGILDRWTPDNPSTTRPASHFGFSEYDSGDFFLQDAWFIRLQNVSLAYSIPNNLLGKLFTSASIRLDAQNLFTITPYNGVDPETNGFDPDVESTGGDTTNLVASYPNVSTYTLGIDLKF